MRGRFNATCGYLQLHFSPALRSMAESFEAQNPEMMDQLRQQFRRPDDDNDTPNP